jgi:hypothetical protein
LKKLFVKNSKRLHISDEKQYGMQGRIIIPWCALEVLQIKDAKERRFTNEPKNRNPNAIPQVSVGYDMVGVLIANASPHLFEGFWSAELCNIG